MPTTDGYALASVARFSLRVGEEGEEEEGEEESAEWHDRAWKLLHEGVVEAAVKEAERQAEADGEDRSGAAAAQREARRGQKHVSDDPPFCSSRCL